jgi:hypothetical protein
MKARSFLMGGSENNENLLLIDGRELDAGQFKNENRIIFISGVFWAGEMREEVVIWKFACFLRSRRC